MKEESTLKFKFSKLNNIRQVSNKTKNNPPVKKIQINVKIKTSGTSDFLLFPNQRRNFSDEISAIHRPYFMKLDTATFSDVHQSFGTFILICIEVEFQRLY